MAGSYEQVTHGWSQIENMGDAYECCQELLWLVHRSMSDEEARRLLDAEFYPMQRGEKPPDAALMLTDEEMETHEPTP